MASGLNPSAKHPGRFMRGSLPTQVSRGRSLSCRATLSNWAGVTARRSICLGEVPSKQSVGALVGAPLPGWARIAKVDFYVGRDGQLLVFGQFQAPVPGDRLSHRSRELANRLDEGRRHLRYRMTACSQRRPSTWPAKFCNRQTLQGLLHKAERMPRDLATSAARHSYPY